MATKPVICSQEAIHIPECDPCEMFGARVDALEDCCEEARAKLENHEGRITVAEENINDLIVLTNEHTTQLTNLDNGKQDKLTAGDRIRIEGNTISAEVDDYVAGENITIDDYVISTPSYTGEGVVSVSNDKKISVDLSDYYDKDHVYTKEEVDALLQNGFEFVPVDTLPTTGERSKVYLLATADPNNRDMYVWYNNEWKKVGSTGVNLDGYVKTTGARETYDEHTVTVWRADGTIRRMTILGIGWENVNTITSGDGYGSNSPGADTGGSVTP